MNEIIDVPMKGQRDLATVTAEIRAYCTAAQTMMVTYAIEIGRRLVEAKSMVKHGEWGDYLREELGLSQSTANNHMKLFEGYAAGQISLTGAALKNQAFANLTYTKALALLALPSEEEREAFVETHDVGSMSTRELQEELRKRSEAQDETPPHPSPAATPSPQGEGFGTGEAEARIAELTQAKEAADKQCLSLQEENRAVLEDAKEATAKARQATARAEEAEAKANEAAKKMLELRSEIEKAKAREKNLKADLERAKQNPTIPKETMNKLRAEAEEAARKAVEAENKTGELDAAKARYEAAELEATKARQEAERLEKELRAAAPEIAEFKFLFGQAQETLSSCVEALPGLPPDKVPGCTKAIKRLLEGALERLEADKWEAAMPE